MKSTIVYYLLIASPLVVLVVLAKNNETGSGWFAILVLLYCLIYRPITDYYRLLNKKVISKKDFWRAFIPFFQAKYFKALYWV